MSKGRCVTLVSSEIGSSGGIERVFLELIIFFSRQGYRVNVVCRSIDASLVPYLEHLKIIEVARGRSLIGRVFYTVLWMCHATFALRSLGKDKGVVIGPPCSVFHMDIVMAGSCHLAALLELHKDGKRIWILNPMNWLIVACERVAFRQSDATIMAPSARTAREIERHYRVPQSQLAVIPHGVDITVFRPADSLQAKMKKRERFGLPLDTIILLSVANELERKGCYLVLRALAKLKARGIDVHYVIAGRADYTQFNVMATSLNVSEAVSLLPSTRDDDLVSLYQAADVFLLPTKYESFGLVCMEALACGVPVIACAVGGIEDYVGTGLDGWLVARTEDAIAEAIECVLKSGLQDRMSAQAREKACAYEWGKVLKPLRRIVDRHRHQEQR